MHEFERCQAGKQARERKQGFVGRGDAQGHDRQQGHRRGQFGVHAARQARQQRNAGRQRHGRPARTPVAAENGDQRPGQAADQHQP